MLSNLTAKISGGAAADPNAVQGASQGAGAGAGAQLPPTATAAHPDGSVGLFDGVWKKALFGLSAGVGIGFLPFIPGGPLIGGLVGALAGTAIGVFGNYKKINAIKTQNQAFVAAIGVQPQTQAEAQALLSGNIQQLYAQNGAAAQQGGIPAGTGSAAQQGGTSAGDGSAAQQGGTSAGVGTTTQQTAQNAAQQQVLAQQQAAAQQALFADQQAHQAQIQAEQTAMANANGGAAAPASVLGATQAAAIGAPQQEAAQVMGATQAAATSSAQGGSDNVAAQAQARLDENQQRMQEIWLNATPAQKKQIIAQLLKQIQQLQVEIAALQAALPQSGGATAAAAGASSLTAPAAA